MILSIGNPAGFVEAAYLSDRRKGSKTQTPYFGGKHENQVPAFVYPRLEFIVNDSPEFLYDIITQRHSNL